MVVYLKQNVASMLAYLYLEMVFILVYFNMNAAVRVNFFFSLSMLRLQ